MDSSTNLSDPDPSKKYKCPEIGCTASYSKPCRLEIHKRKHSEERPFVCDAENCDKAFTQLAHLKRHKSYVHERTSEILCTAQGCGRVFNNKYSLRKHVNQQHSSSNMFKCAHCLQEFKKKRQLKQHLYIHGGEDALKCLTCNISFQSFHLYNKHKKNHKTYTCDCETEFSKWTLFCEHRKSCSVKKIDHKCVICNKIFKTKSNLKEHSLSHLEESQIDVYHCPYLNCKRNYKYKKNLNCHIAVYHEKKGDDVRINCTAEGCDMTFKSKKNLKQHVLNIHEGARKKKKDRKPRKDKGKKKTCMAAVLSGISLPLKEHLAILKSSESQKLQSSISNETINKEKFNEQKAEEIVVAAAESTVESVESDTSTNEHIPNKEQTIVVSVQNFELPLNEDSFLNEACINDIIILDDTGVILNQ